MHDDVIIRLALLVAGLLGIITILRWSLARVLGLLCALGAPAALWYFWQRGDFGLLERLLH
jgi:hypothetical protein